MTEADRTNTAAGRDAKGRFGPGNPGKPRGARHRLNRDALDHLAGLVSPSFVVLRDHLSQGNLKAATYILDRFLPASRVVALESVHPDSVAEAMAMGDATPAEAARMAQTFKTVADASEVKELRERLDELEAEIARARR